MITCGVDIGSTSIEVLLLREGIVVDSLCIDTGAFPAENAKKIFESLLKKNGIERSQIHCITATGFGRNYFTESNKVVSEISCHTAGVAALYTGVRTIIEIGGQDSKMIRVGEGGKVLDFIMNDRCAAGTGKFIEAVARTMAMPIEETGEAALRSDTPCDISSMCAVFAESEIVGLLHRGISAGSILRGVFRSVTRRIIGMSGRIGLNDDIVFTGGVAKNIGVVHALREIVGREIFVPAQPQYTGALGAAIVGMRNGTP
jgi:predicted CoA-substrate-specific enzyme activase